MLSSFIEIIQFMLQLLAIIKVENEMLTVKCAVRSVVALQGSFVVITGNLMGVVI